MMVADRIIGPLRSMDRQKRTMIGAGLALAIATAGAGYWAGSSGLFTENGSSAGAQGETIDGVVQDGSGQRVLYWYDPMIPMERYDAPGKSSMNMALIPKYADGAADGGVRPTLYSLFLISFGTPTRIFGSSAIHFGHL